MSILRPTVIPIVAGHLVLFSNLFAAAQSSSPASPAQSPQSAPPAQSARVSVWDSVYSASQASRGEQAYASACSACHGRDLKGVRDNRALIGDRFWQDWGEDSLGVLHSTVQRTMPRNAPGSLSAQDYLDIVAYLLQQNGYPAGNNELTAETVDAVWVMRKEGPGPVPNFSLVWVVGCLEKETDGWVLSHTSEPIKTRNPAASEGAERDRASSAALGTQIFGLMDLPSKQAEHAGKKVEAKGLLIRGPRSKLNLTSLQPLDAACAP